jgi:uncharacterized membrane protein
MHGEDMVTDDLGWGGWIVSVSISVASLIWEADRLIMESERMLFASINPIWLVLALLTAIIVGEALLYYGKYAKANAQKAKAISAATKADRPVTAEIEEFDKIYIPSMVVSGAITAFVGYSVLFDVLPGLALGFEIVSPVFAAFLAFVIALIFMIIIDYPVHELANAVRNGGITKAQLALVDALNDPEKRDKLFQAVTAMFAASGENVVPEIMKEIIDGIPSKELDSAAILKLAEEYLKKAAEQKVKDLKVE